MNANYMTFGVEFEMAIPAGTVRVGGYHCGAPVPAPLSMQPPPALREYAREVVAEFERHPRRGQLVAAREYGAQFEARVIRRWPTSVDVQYARHADGACIRLPRTNSRRWSQRNGVYPI
jgi:hypothetical protein